jgi:hypothetical protein
MNVHKAEKVIKIYASLRFQGKIINKMAKLIDPLLREISFLGYCVVPRRYLVNNVLNLPQNCSESTKLEEIPEISKNLKKKFFLTGDYPNSRKKHVKNL